MKNKPEQWEIPAYHKIFLEGTEYTYLPGADRSDGLVALRSKERGIKRGDCRIIMGKLFFAGDVVSYSMFGKKTIYWWQKE